MLSDQAIIRHLNEHYGIEIYMLKLLPIGADLNSRIYKADAADRSYFVKLKNGAHEDIGVSVMNLLKKAGLSR